MTKRGKTFRALMALLFASTLALGTVACQEDNDLGDELEDVGDELEDAID